MDSILRGYPFGTFRFWKVKKETVNQKQYSMYHFIKNYHERDNFCNEAAQLPFAIDADNPDKLEDWLQIPANRDNVKYLPQGISYKLENFEQFLAKRKELMLAELKRLLVS